MRRIALAASAFLLLTVVAITGGPSTHPSAVQHVYTKPALAAYHVEVLTPPTTTTTTPPPPLEEPPAPPAPEPTTTTPPETVPAAPAPAAVDPTPVPSGDAESAIAQWFPDNYQSAVNVAQCESGMDPGAVSRGGGNWGLFQINTVHRDSFESVTGQPWSQVLNANYNAQFAAWLFTQSGWGPWSCRWAA